MNMVEQVTDYVKNYDEEVGKAIELELGRQRRNLELIASENIISLRFNTGVSLSFKKSSLFPAALPVFSFAAPFSDAPYPAFSTASII